MLKPNEQAENRHAGTWRGALLALSFAALTLTGWLWVFELWMLPEFLRNRITTLQPIAAAIGISGILTWALWCRDGRWLKVAGTCLTVAVVLCGLRWFGGMLAVATLTKNIPFQGGSTERNPILWKKLETAVSARGIPVPEWLERKTKSEWIEGPRVWHLLECSRWPVRGQFVKRAMKIQEQALALGMRWNTFFPAVTGADVEYRNRRNLMETLDRIRCDPTALQEARATAVLWMGLVILTDPPEFSAWREKVRDALIQCPNPVPQDRGDGWMRTIDVLLTFDPPKKWESLTEPLTGDPEILRRAVRQRVRGMAYHVDAIINEAEASEKLGDEPAAFALWLDTGRLIAAYPELTPSERLIEWRRKTMFRWLSTGGPDWTAEIRESGEWWSPYLFDDSAIAMSQDEEQALAKISLEIADEALEFAKTAETDSLASAEYIRRIEHLQVLHVYLSDDSRRALARRIGPVLVRLPLLIDHRMKRNKRPTPIPERRIRCLVGLWPSLPTECRETYGMHFREYWQKTPPQPVLLCLAAWSGTSSISEEEWILSAFSRGNIWWGPQFKLVDASDAPERIPWFAPYPIPRIRDSSLRSVIDRLCIAEESMRSAKPGQSPSTLWRESMQRSSKPGPLPDWISADLFRTIANDRNIDIPDDFEIPSDEVSIRINLLLAGLQEPDDSLTDLIAYNITRNPHFGNVLRNRDDLPDPWSGLLKSPEQAGDFIKNVRLDDRRFRNLLSASVKKPPAPEVMAPIWQALRERSSEGKLESRLEAFGALFRLSPLISSGQRLEMRADFLRLLVSTPIPRRYWPVELMEPGEFERSIWPGEGIPWEDDALSAALSWSSDIKAETTFVPGEGVPETRTGVFSYLAQAFVLYDDEGLGGVFVESADIHTPFEHSYWKRAPLRNPLEATPWQRARALHLRRPDLKWPDRTWLRPVRRSD